MANTSPPLFTKISKKQLTHRALNVTVLSLLISLLVYRILHINNHGFAWVLALLCETWFTFIFALSVSSKWNPVVYETYPELLSQRVKEQDLPLVDMLMTTADPVLEPPVITVNTVLSLLAVDYPANKLACYVSDDGCSPLTFYALLEATNFAKLWVPFCKKYGVQPRAPFKYFTNGSIPNFDDCKSLDFQHDWKMMKDKYEELIWKIRVASETSIPWNSTNDFDVFKNVERRNHATIIKIIHDNKEGASDGLPHLIYISREKRPKHPHHYKAGAMNVFARVSGMITNAPYMLNVDCDMFVNNPQILLHAMCMFFGSKNERESGFVQSPQQFYDGIKDDPYGNQVVVLVKYFGQGMAGLQGMMYCGTNCFTRRKIIYGLCPEDDDTGNRARHFKASVDGKIPEDEKAKLFGKSKEFIESAMNALDGKEQSLKNISDLVDAAYKVAGCDYECGTSWGQELGWQYGSVAEDAHTSMMMQTRGWRSLTCSPEPKPFLGSVPSDASALMIQQKRWATGLLEVLISRWSPVLGTIKGKLDFRQVLAYIWIFTWPLRSIPELCYALLPAYCIITNSSFLPKVQLKEPATLIPVAAFVIFKLYTLLEYLETGLSVRSWWNNQRMQRINTISGWLFGLLSVVLKLIGASEMVFDVTQKDQSTDEADTDPGRFTFNESLIFVLPTTILILQLASLGMVFLGLRPVVVNAGNGLGLLEIMCSSMLVMYLWPFVKGLVRRGKYGIPTSVKVKSAILAVLFVQLCKTTT